MIFDTFSRPTSLLLTSLTLAASACVLEAAPTAVPASNQVDFDDGGAPDDAELGFVTVELTSTPAGVQCIRIAITNGGSTTIPSFAVATGSSTSSLELGSLTPGYTTFTGTAYDRACTNVNANTVPDWVGPSVSATVQPGINPAINLTLMPNATATVGVNFREPIQSLWAGRYSTYAVLADRSVRAWGLGGAVADGSTTNQLVPVTSTLLSDIVSIEGSKFSSHQCAVSSMGALSCWGENSYGQLGDGTTTSRSTPTVLRGSGTLSVAPGGGFTCYLRASNNRPYCSGDNSQGALGRGDTTNTNVFVETAIPTLRFAELAAGYRAVCGRLLSGHVYCWGDNDSGQVGNSAVGTDALLPTSTGLEDTVQLAAGAFHFCARKGDGTVWCWGRNGLGELGDGTGVMRPIPVQVPGITTAVQIEASYTATCARLQDQTVKCWGDGSALGSGTGVTQRSPLAVRNLTGAVSLAMGSSHACALLTSGDVRCWGSNVVGQLGDGTVEDRPTPVTTMW